MTAPALLLPLGTPLTPGKLYLHLFHGRTHPEQEMDDWGFPGPTFGSLGSVHQTYGTELRLSGESATAELWLPWHDDLIVWDGCYFGDVAVYVAGSGDVA